MYMLAAVASVWVYFFRRVSPELDGSIILVNQGLVLFAERPKQEIDCGGFVFQVLVSFLNVDADLGMLAGFSDVQFLHCLRQSSDCHRLAMLYQISLTDIEDPLPHKLDLVSAEPSIVILSSKFRDLPFVLLLSHCVSERRELARLGSAL
jgi:hypothetical protein